VLGIERPRHIKIVKEAIFYIKAQDNGGLKSEVSRIFFLNTSSIILERITITAI
jgi:hypothetical protein